jgi:Tfp pilus assembly protein FimT
MHLLRHQVSQFRSLALCPGAVSEDALIENERTAATKRPINQRGHRGISLVEMMIVVAIAMTIAGMIVVHLTPTLQTFRSNSAASQVTDVFRQAREYAITYRRYVQITFPNYTANGTTANNEITITVKNTLTPTYGGAVQPDVVLANVFLSGNVTFQVEKGLPDSPDGFGNATPVNFGGVDSGPLTGMFFQADGTFVNLNGNFVNGSVFLGQNNTASTARAVTVLGTTGRIRAYNINGAGTGWFETR